MLTWGIPIAINFYTMSRPTLMVKLFPVMMLLFIVGVLGWIWAISTQLHKKLPPQVDLNVRKFKIIFSIPILYSLSLTIWLAYRFYFRFQEGNPALKSAIWIIVLFHVASMICILIGLRFAAQTLRSVELGRRALFFEYSIEFFLIWFSPVGFWILQPRLNRIMKNT